MHRGVRLPSVDPFAAVVEGGERGDEDARGRLRAEYCTTNVPLKWRIAGILFVLIHASLLFALFLAERPIYYKPLEDDVSPKPYSWGVTKQGLWENRHLPLLNRDRIPQTQAPTDSSVDLFGWGDTKKGQRIMAPLPRLRRIAH